MVSFRYSIVGVMEQFNMSLAVMQNYLPGKKIFLLREYKPLLKLLFQDFLVVLVSLWEI